MAINNPAPRSSKEIPTLPSKRMNRSLAEDCLSDKSLLRLLLLLLSVLVSSFFHRSTTTGLRYVATEHRGGCWDEKVISVIIQSHPHIFIFIRRERIKGTWCDTMSTDRLSMHTFSSPPLNTASPDEAKINVTGDCGELKASLSS